MKQDLIKAKELLSENGYSCVLVKDDIVYHSSKTGIAPMIDFIDAKLNLKDFSVADLIVGKAAAMLFALANVSHVYGKVMSKGAIKVFDEYKIEYFYQELVENIINRSKTGLCPMEIAVKNAKSPLDGYNNIKNKMKEIERSLKQ